VFSVVAGAQSSGHSQGDKRRLRKFFRRLRVARVSQCDGIDHIHDDGPTIVQRQLEMPSGDNYQLL
jgi:hypothetical protein